ncbi:MAG: DegV family protein [Clostridia bacterium]|nr:DegV family protein [Clostridia bacterium]
MSKGFAIVTDSTSNLPTPMLEEKGISVIPITFSFDGEEHCCLDTTEFSGGKGDMYYKRLKEGARVTTSQVSPQQYIDVFEPILKMGEDIIFVGMSSGISGSYNSAELAAAQMREAYPERKLRIVDTLAASLGEGKAVLRAVECREKGMSLDKTADLIESERQSLYQVAMLDDLMFLHKGGRISAPKALLGTLLGIRPILKGNKEGRLVLCGKTKGRKRGLEVLADAYRKLVDRLKDQLVCIAYTDCPEDAYTLRDMLEAIWKPKGFLIERYEPVTGSYAGPGTVALFFEGCDGVRNM